MTCTESATTEFRFHIEYLNEQREPVRDEKLTLADFAHAIRHARFDAFRSGVVPSYDPLATDKAIIEPIFGGDAARSSVDAVSPQIQAFTVTVRRPDGTDHRCQYETRYFTPAANQLRAELIRSEAMAADQELYYRIQAFLDDDLTPVRTDANKLAISLKTSSHSIATSIQPRSDYGPAEPWDAPSPDDLPVLMAEHVLEEAVEEARADPEREVAGFLLGRLHRDADTQQVYVAVTGLASSGGTTESSSTSVTYTPASFARVKDVIKLRDAGEMVCGWYHSHPFRFCSECPLPTPPECIGKVLFYSNDDMHLMQTTFEQPFMVGLLAAVEPRIEQAIGHLPVKLYGWRQGEVRERGFEVITEEPDF